MVRGTGRGTGRVVLGALVWTLGCASTAAPTVGPEPGPDRDFDDEQGTFSFVSTERNTEDDGDDDDAPAPEQFEGDPKVTTPTAAVEIAEAAVADRLNPRQRWETSPVMPASWPGVDRHVKVYFFPMAANPSSLSHFQLFSPAYVVTVSLDDGTTDVRDLESRKLGMIEDKRASRLEREERELAETALVHYLLSGDSDEGENAFWGYLKFIHEHPKMGKDLERRHAKFVGWLKKRNHRR